MKTGIEIIGAERQRQILSEGWDERHDDAATEGQLCKAAGCYAFDAAHSIRHPGEVLDRENFWPPSWPWASGWWKPTPKDLVKQLAKAGALIAAEIDRINRKSS